MVPSFLYKNVKDLLVFHCKRIRFRLEHKVIYLLFSDPVSKNTGHIEILDAHHCLEVAAAGAEHHLVSFQRHALHDDGHVNQILNTE